MRNYIVASWSDADQYDYSGEMLGGSRHQGRSQRVHFNPDGSACVASYGDDEVKTKKINIKDRILPQFKRLQTLQGMMLDLEREYKTTDMSISEYSVLRDVLVSKVQRVEVLYRKAIAQKPAQTPEDEEETYADSLSTPSDNNGHGESYSSPVGGRFFAEVIDELSDQNSFKSFLKNACLVTRTLVTWSQQAAAYYRTLKEV
ncbi:hypothetical protein [Robertmurraya sp.]|uniref:hypothetical protein n=1 Tax=Robertmurraya sp. TaxID=2837525 RepID=UPI003703E81E